MVPVPLADPLRLVDEEARAVRAAFDAVLSGGSLVLGPWVEAFEADLAAYLAADGPPPAVVGVGNGTDALTIALLALDLPAACFVLVPANDGGYAATAVRGAGLLPVPADVDPVTQLVDVSTLDAATCPGVRAAVVTHLHGQPADLAPIQDWAHERGLLLVEDVAQALGATVGDRRAGTLGDAAAFSFYPTKNLGALGDAGAVVTPHREVAARARRLREYGWGEPFRPALPHGRNSRLDALQAAVLSVRLPFVDEGNRRRRSVVERYRAAVGSDTVVLGDAPGAVAHHAVVVHAQRERLASTLERHGVATRVHYPWLVTEMPGLGLAPVSLPGADRGRQHKLSLPCFPALTDAEVEQVTTALADWSRDLG